MLIQPNSHIIKEVFNKMKLLANPKIQTALALSAASALIYEVVATNFLFFYFTKSSYSIAAVLSIFLLGLGIGSLIVYKIQEKIRNEKNLFGTLQVLVAAYALVVLANLSEVISKISTLGIVSTSFAILIVPTIFLGAIFPLSAHIFKKETSQKDATGLIYSSDLFGAILGTLIAGFILIPKLGNGAAITFGALLNIASAIIIFSGYKKIIPLIVLTISLIGYETPISASNRHYQFYSPSPFGEIVVHRNTLYIDRREQCALTYPKDTTERTIVLHSLRVLDKPNPKVLNIGLGCGLTLSEILGKTASAVDVVEINPVIIEANKNITTILENPRVNLILGDGLTYLKKTNQKYDVIIIDVEDPGVAYSSDFYTVEAFKIIASKLNSDGNLALWDYKAGQKYTDVLYYSLKEYFPFVYKFEGVSIASNRKADSFGEYKPKTSYALNTIDRKILSEIYKENNYSVNMLQE